MTRVDYKDYAAKLHIVNIFQANPTGVVTNPVLYRPYSGFNPRGGIIHATVGRNSLAYLANNDRLVCAHQLLPKDDYTIYNMVPDGYGCAHAGIAEWGGERNFNMTHFGFELENLQDFHDPFTEAQYIKLALSWAYKSAAYKLLDIHLLPHALIAQYGTADELRAGHKAGDRGRRQDPYAGPFNNTRLFGHLYEIRQPENWPGEIWSPSNPIPLWQAV